MNGVPWVMQGQDWRESVRLGQRVADEQCSLDVQGQDWRGSGCLGRRAG